MNLSNCRIRHAWMLSLHNAMRSYLNCLERGYLGELENFELNTMHEIRDAMMSIEGSCEKYYEMEAKLLGENK